MSQDPSFEPTDPNQLLDRFLSLSFNQKQRAAEFVEPDGIAVLLGLTVGRIRQLADEGRLPHTKVFGRIYVHVPTLVEMLRAANARR